MLEELQITRHEELVIMVDVQQKQKQNPKSLSSIVKSLISIPDKRIAAIVSGSSSLVTSKSFSRDSAAFLKAFLQHFKVNKTNEINPQNQSMSLRICKSKMFKNQPEVLELQQRIAMMLKLLSASENPSR